MKIISHNMKPEELRSFDIYSTDDSGLFDSVPYMRSVKSTKQEQEEADSEDYDSFDEWLYFVSGSDDFIHFADEDEEVEFVVLPKDELIMYMWLDDGPDTSKVERVLKDFVGGKMVEVPAKPGWFEGAVRNFPPFNDDEHKTYVCMNGKYYTYPSELEKKGVEESHTRRGRMLKESEGEYVGKQKFTREELEAAFEELEEKVSGLGGKLDITVYSDVNGSTDLDYMDFNFKNILEDLKSMPVPARSVDYEVCFSDEDETTGHGLLIKRGTIAKVY